MDPKEKLIQDTIKKRLLSIPRSFRKRYLKAVSGKSKRCSVICACQECMGFIRKEVCLCNLYSCSLWMFRPYQDLKGVAVKVDSLEKKRDLAIQKEYNRIPKSFRMRYLKAMKGDSRPRAVEMYCSRCMGFDRESVCLCTSYACPLWPYRPYQKYMEI